MAPPKGFIPWNKGKKGVQPRSEETKRKISESMKGRSTAWLKGRKQTEESNQKRSKALQGSNSHLWKDGRSKLPGYHSYIDANRRQRKRQNAGNHSFEQWFKLKVSFKQTCPSCARPEPEIVLTRDHIVPIRDGGSDDIENIQPLCKSCNSSKKCKVIKYSPLLV